MSEKVLVLGASPHKDRFSYKAMNMLLEYGHEVILVNPNYDEIDGRKVFKSLEDVSEEIDTLTLYLNPKISSQMAEGILNLNPKRVILNPGTENPTLEKSLHKASIPIQKACTLVLLSTGSY
jgi:predicted CoA-binding protein